MLRKMKREQSEREETQQNAVGQMFKTTGEYAYIPLGDMTNLARPIGDVRLLEKNPRINDDASKKLAELIKENGFRKAIVIDQNGIVRAGNTAYKAARLLGMKRIPATQSAFANESDAVRYVVSDNVSSEWALWDKEMLRDLMEKNELDKGKGIGTGFSEAQLKKLFEMRQEQQVVHKMEVSVACKTEEEAKELFDRLTEEGYKCRVLAL